MARDMTFHAGAEVREWLNPQDNRMPTDDEIGDEVIQVGISIDYDDTINHSNRTAIWDAGGILNELGYWVMEFPVSSWEWAVAPKE